MLKTKSERALLIVFVGVLVVAVGKSTLYERIAAPIAEKKSELSRLQDQIDQGELDLRRAAVAAHELDELKNDGSLLNATGANVLFQERLVSLAQQAGLKDAVITPLETIALDSVGERLAFSVQAQGDSQSLAHLLAMLEGDSIATRVPLVALERIEQGRIYLTVNTEVLAVETQDEDWEIKTINPLSQESTLQLALKTNDPFVRGYDGPKRPTQPLASTPTPAPAPTPKVDPLASIRLVGLVNFGGETRAWLFDSRSKDEYVYGSDETIEIEDWSGRILQAEGDTLTLEVNGREHQLRLGASLNTTRS